MTAKTLSKTARALIYTRQSGTCFWCGYGMHEGDFQAHHRLERSHGGTWDPANIVALHGHCHNVQPRSVHQEPKRAYSLGFLLRTSRFAPAELPIMNLASGNWWLFTSDSMTPCLPSDAGELLFLAGNLRESVA